MEKIKQFIQNIFNHTNWIIIMLMLIILMQACGSCSKKTKYQFEKAEQSEKIIQKDSIIITQKTKIDSLNTCIVLLQDSIKLLESRNEQSKNYIQGLQDDKKMMRDIIRQQGK